MSIKIYNGYRLTVRASRAGEHSFESIISILNAFKLQARAATQTLVHKQAAHLCARIVDQRMLDIAQPIDGSDVPPDWSPMMGAVRILIHRFKQACDGSVRDPVYDFETRVTILSADAEVLALLWCEKAEVAAVWEALDGVEPFPYWNNTDRPADISEEEWALRESIWLEAAGDDVWSVAGLTTEVIGRYGLPTPDLDGVMAYLPTIEQRAKLYALDRVVTRRCRTLNRTMTAVEAVQDALRWVHETRDGNAALRVETDVVAEALPTITASMLVRETEPAETRQ